MSIWAHPVQVAGRHAGAGEEHGLTDAGPRPPAFEHAGLETGLLRLRCVTPGRLEAALIAWLGGMEAGRAGLLQAVGGRRARPQGPGAGADQGRLESAIIRS